MKPKDVVPSLLVFLAATVAAYLILFLTGGDFQRVVEQVANASMWAVPLTLAVSIAMFTNMLRVYDRLEKYISELPKTGNEISSPDEVEAALQETDAVTVGLLGNSFITVAAALLFFCSRGLREIPSPEWLPIWVHALSPTWLAVAAEFGFGAVVIVILLVQFATVPPLVELYRYFAVGRYLSNADRNTAASGEESLRKKPEE